MCVFLCEMSFGMFLVVDWGKLALYWLFLAGTIIQTKINKVLLHAKDLNNPCSMDVAAQKL